MVLLPQTMRSLVAPKHGSPVGWEVAEVPVPTITSPTDVIIRVKAGAVMKGDCQRSQGSPIVALRKESFPIKIGCEGSGIVVAVGADVKTLKVGDAVYGLCFTRPAFSIPDPGFCSEYAVGPERLFLPKPPHMSFEEAASLLGYTVTAYQTIRRGLAIAGQETLEGKTVFIPGALSGGGFSAIQVAKNVFGARKIISTVSTSKMSLVEQHLPGMVDELIDYTTTDVGSVIPKGSVDFMYNTQWNTMGPGIPLLNPKTGILMSIASIPPPTLTKELLGPALVPFWVVWVLHLAQLWYSFLLRGTNIKHEFVSGNPENREDLEKAGELIATGKVKGVFRVVDLADFKSVKEEYGRTLSYTTFGITPQPNQPTIFHFHGLPGSHHEGQPVHEEATRRNICVVAVTRPGYGGSTFQPNRTILSFPQDVLHLADNLKIQRFAVLGISGGAPYALACLHSISPSRLSGVAIVSGMFPSELGLSGMMLMNRLLFSIAPWSPGLIESIADWEVGNLARDAEHPERLARATADAFKSRPVEDREALYADDGKILRVLEQSTREAFRESSRGFAWEAKLFGSSWGFELKDLVVQEGKLVIWHAGKDVNVPLRMAQDAAGLIRASTPTSPSPAVAPRSNSSSPRRNEIAENDHVAMQTENNQIEVDDTASRLYHLVWWTILPRTVGVTTRFERASEMDRLDLNHMLIMKTIGRKLFLAPIPPQSIHRILDIGTGTGIWAIEAADVFQNAEILGIDLSAIQPSWVPPNVKFEIDDVESPWVNEHKFDFIFCRYMAGSIADWEKLIKNIFDNLAPGGWVEFQDYDISIVSDDGTLTEKHHTSKWMSLLIEACVSVGRDPRPGPNIEGWVKDAGFVDVVHQRFKMPIGPWPKDPHHKDVGMTNLIQLLDGLEGFSLRAFCGILGWTKEEVLVLLAQVRTELKSGSFHARSAIHVVYAQKSEEKTED
ncbi:UMTA methyltransferase [Colletotrichum tamarilloi]|uniref:UMTA methyltransferase n=1 Tax=Colletotrichum tamarilloi TaxID=1209934 RepID=A0ABQ9R554_9PEZI|nr:UMTA methyltransferase [Colletotrichum tamarilloi]KAK1494838.1 UMTA methyltransferase [Colletotrichum tamarilloi]